MFLKDFSREIKKVKGSVKITSPANPQDGDGALQPLAASVLMKLLYTARMARYDLLRPVCRLATYVTKWTPECDAAWTIGEAFTCTLPSWEMYW